MLRDATGAGRRAAKRLVELSPRIVLKHGGLTDVSKERLFEADVPVGDAEAVAIQEVDELVVARERDVEAELDRWMERAAEWRRDRNVAMVDRVISEHRAERTTSE